MLWLLSVSAALASCPADPAGLAAALDRAERAFVSLEVETFRRETDVARDMIDCMSAPVDAQTAARLLRARGLRAFADQDEAGARAAFAAARAADPSFEFSTALLPPNHPLRAMYAAPGVAATPVAINPPRQGEIQVDGVAADSRSTSWPAVVVWTSRGEVIQSAWLEPGEPMFSTGPAGTASLPAPPAHTSRKLLISAGAAAVASGGLLAASRVHYNAFVDPATPLDELDPLRGRTNSLYYAGAGLGVLALGVGIGAVVIGTW